MTSPASVLITDFLDDSRLETPILEDLAVITNVMATHERDLIPHLPEARAFLLFHDIAMLTDATFALAPKLQVVVRAGVGYNNVDLEAAGARGIAVCNVPDYGSEEVADHAIMLMLAVARRLIPQHEDMRRGVWDYKVGLGTPRLRGRVFGVVGCGRIGTAAALRAKAFGMDVVIYDPNIPPGVEKALGVRREYELAPLLRQADVVSLHCLLDPTSRGLIDARALELMKPDAILINTARGPVVDQDALISALEAGKLTGAGIDVFEREPLDDERLRSHPRVVLTPHSAFYSVEGFEEMRRKAAEEVRRILEGKKPRNLVNRDRLVAPRIAAW
ncbi:MAG: C-terminal binding protein [Isosphaeraceae bacterium]|nr:C-terminal binding protein [Isosphaeraceae bacterium]